MLASNGTSSRAQLLIKNARQNGKLRAATARGAATAEADILADTALAPARDLQEYSALILASGQPLLNFSVGRELSTLITRLVPNVHGWRDNLHYYKL